MLEAIEKLKSLSVAKHQIHPAAFEIIEDAIKILEQRLGTSLHESLSERVFELCESRGWSMKWTDRLAYLGLESAEFVEAVRGKRGDKIDEAGDVLITVIALITPYVSLDEAISAADRKIEGLMKKPKYKGEECTKAGS